MQDFLKAARIISSCFFALAVVIIGYILFYDCHRWTVLEHPVKIEDGYSFSQAFTVDRTTTYELAIRGQASRSFTTQETILNQIAAQVVVHDGQQIIVDRDTHPLFVGGYGPDRKTCLLADFTAKTSHRYELNMRFTRSLPELASTHPVAVLAVNWKQMNDAAVGTLISMMVVLVILLIGLFILLAAQITAKIRHRATIQTSSVDG